MNLSLKLSPYIEYGLGTFTYLVLPIACLNIVASTPAPLLFSDNLVPGTIGFSLDFAFYAHIDARTSRAYFYTLEKENFSSVPNQTCFPHP